MDQELDYSISMWLPPDLLFGFLTQIARLDGSDALRFLIWPDGRRLRYVTSREFCRPNYGDTDLVPIDPSLPVYKSFFLSFGVEPDEALLRYEKAKNEVKENGATGNPELREDGTHSLSGIDCSLNLSADQYCWAGEEEIQVRVNFRAADMAMSLLFEESVSVRQFFTELARDYGADLCFLDKDVDIEVLFARGRVAEAARGQTYFENGFTILRPGLAQDTEVAQKIFLCNTFSKDWAETDLARIEDLRFDADPGVRSSAYRQIGTRWWYGASRQTIDRALSLLLPGLQDEHWLVRASTADAMSKLRAPVHHERLQAAIKPLLEALSDPRIEVKIAVVESLSRFEDATVFEAVLDIFERTPLGAVNFGLIKVCLSVLYGNRAGRNVSNLVRRRAAEPNLPFPRLAAYAVKQLDALRNG